MPENTTPDNLTSANQPEIIHDPAYDGLFGWVLVQLKSFLLTLWDILTDILLMVVDLFMSVGLYALEGISQALELINITNYINVMPAEVLGIVNAIGLGEAIGMIMAAGTARLLMQLIPFVRLGS
jgi:hypothetical protein